MPAHTHTLTFSAAFLALLCSACSPGSSSNGAAADTAAAPAAQAAPVAASAGDVSYELVTETRPKDFAAFKKFHEDAYKACATVVKLSQRAVVPMAEVSPDIVLNRETWTSDGRNFLYKSEVRGIGLPEIEAGCRQKPTHSTEYRLSKAEGSFHTWGEDSESGPVALASEALERVAPLPTPNYTREKTVNGIALRCLSADEIKVAANVVEESCFVDTLQGHKVRDSYGQLIGAYTVSRYAGAALQLVQVPVSAKVKVDVNPTLFKTP